MSVRLLLVCVLGAAPVLAGCGASDTGRHEVSGTVTYRGEPVDEGVIGFEPLDGQGTRDGATILNGVYRIPREKGLVPGRYRVSVVIGDGVVSAGTASPDNPTRKPGATPGRERAPPEFNTRSTLIREVSPGGPNTFDFAIP
jgi:hypothetical protein